MGLGTKLMEKAAGAVFLGAATVTTAVVGGVVGGTIEGVSGAVEKASDKKAKAKKAQAKQKKQQASKAIKNKNSPQKTDDEPKTIAKPNYSEYDVRLICAKVAICGYIIFSDNQFSEAESNYINYLFGGILNEYGQEVYDKAVKAYQNSARSFMNLQDYLRKVNLKDVKMYLNAADEVAETDGINDSERQALQRIRDYIEQQETGAAQSLICPSCGGVMSIDDYGYKAFCTSCGREVIVDSSNAPSSAYREINKPAPAAEKKTPAKKVAVVEEKAEPAKSKKGKIALKVAVGVLTGGVSLIPDAVDAAKKKGKKETK